MQSQDRPPDNLPDLGADGRWMTFAELGQSRDINKASAIKLVRRHGWRRQKDNEGHVRALVPVIWATADDARESDSTAGRTKDITADMSRAISALYTAVTAFREQLGHERARAEAAERRADQAEAKAEARAEAAERRAEARTTAAIGLLREASESLTAERAS
jgi:hypothetical protein